MTKNDLCPIIGKVAGGAFWLRDENQPLLPDLVNASVGKLIIKMSL